MRILGINLSHDGSACLLEDGKIKVALALERLTRVQRGVLPQAQVPRAVADLIDYCLSAGGVSFGDIDYFIGTTTETASSEEEAQVLRDIGYFPREKILSLPHPSHHLAHACAAFYGSGFESAAALVVDAYGSRIDGGRESETAFWFERNCEPRVLLRERRGSVRIAGALKSGRLLVPKTLFGIGEIYRIITLLLGFRQSGTYYDDAGKTMGLAPYGRLLSKEPQMIRVVDGQFDFSNAYAFLESYNLVSQEDGVSYLNVRPEDAPFSRFHCDLACQAQWEFEEAALALTRRVLDASGADTLVLGGGSFLNSVLNQRILKETGVRRLFIFPAATDDGNAVGAAWYAHHRLLAQPQPSPPCRMSSIYLGRTYRDAETRAALEACDCPFEMLDDERSAAEMAAKHLSEGRIVGWCQGGAEFGPRALGNRSILANPCVADIKDRLNSTVKFRESFRPFAGAVPTEVASRYFDLEAPESPYMLLVCAVKESARSLIPGVTHVDGTCRVQTVSAEDNAPFHELLLAFGRRTGVPVVLNTSFNLRGMPIVETPIEALHCFLATQMHGLFLGRHFVPAPKYESFVPVLAEAAPAVTEQERRMLEAIDGKKTVSSLAVELQMQVQPAVASCLALYRRRLIRWRHIEPLSQIAASRSHFNIDPR